MGFEETRFVAPVPADLKCALCRHVVDNPMETSCGNVFCAGCVLPSVLRDGTCPMKNCCGKGTMNVYDLKRVARINNTVQNLELCCDFARRGCSEIVLVSDLPNHVKLCKYRVVLCRNKGCSKTMEFRELEKHENELCEFRPVGICQKGCSLVISLRELESHSCIQALRDLVSAQEIQINVLESDLKKMIVQEKAREKNRVIQVNNLHNSILVQANKFQQKIGYYQKAIEELVVRIKADVKERVSILTE
jgi:ligand of Numb protein X 3/4